jgi:hypothetical protein
VFESSRRLSAEVLELLDAVRGLGGGRYACVVEPKGILFESPEPEDRGAWALRRFLEEKCAALFAIPRALADGTAMEDAFADWQEDEFFLAFINGRVALVVACPEAEPLRARAFPLLKVLADRLFRYNETYRLDPEGRGLFFGRPRLDIVVVGGAHENG